MQTVDTSEWKEPRRSIRIDAFRGLVAMAMAALSEIERLKIDVEIAVKHLEKCSSEMGDGSEGFLDDSAPLEWRLRCAERNTALCKEYASADIPIDAETVTAHLTIILMALDTALRDPPRASPYFINSAKAAYEYLMWCAAGKGRIA